MLMLTIASLACGFIFGLGLLVSGMLQPTKVLGFLDIFGVWDPSLAVVRAAALVRAQCLHCDRTSSFEDRLGSSRGSIRRQGVKPN